ncbi:PAS domain-containing sensor histidine kinase [Catalinimonas niigatensis]|uniref:PAS domain-containing sensor histidine kinase n=1 Tax=Catalinimonas niigatensis TaxID=1397264 RepID=UPI00266575CE|nr:PAS domain-containing sensor histidine kinase [Catalinimonas niigatensis]WPP51690.1 PAS domain-containing sensor histidine kinase [Catalinimonas niigatensis]
MKKKNKPGDFNFLHKLAEQAKHVIFAFDIKSNQFLYLNPYFEELWQLKREEVMSNPAVLLSAIHAEDKEFVESTYQELLSEINNKNKRGKDIEFRIYSLDDSVRWLRFNSFMYEEHSDQRIIAGMIENITDLKEHTHLLNKFAAKKNAVLEILSHDLSRPLTNIQSLSGILADELKPYNEKEIDKIIGMIAESSKRGINLIRTFVQQEFLESAQAKLIKKRVNIVHECKMVMDQYQEEEQMVGKTFYFEASSDAISMRIDDAKFMQVINNLLSNAIKFTQEGGVITVRVLEEDDHVLITVEDDGVGIPKHLQEGLFDRFSKARREGLKGEPSTGLGMSIIKNIVEWHKGKIWFESKEQKGTIFYIKLPKK